MRLRIDFGTDEKDRESIHWYKELNDFPHLISHNRKKWEWAMYSPDDSNIFDYVLVYTEVPSYDPNYWAYSPTLDDIRSSPKNKAGCECGAEKTSFPWDHMRFCEEWKPW